MSEVDTEGWTPEELAELAAAEAELAAAEAAEAAGTGVAGAADESKRSSPTYGVLTVADAFPEQEKAKRGGGGPSKKLLKQLQVLVDTEELHGKAVKVIEFTTSNGAKSAIDDVLKGQRQIPDGVWVLKALRTNDAQGKRVSHLWAVYQGPRPEGETGSDVTDATEKPASQTEANEVSEAPAE